MIKYLGSKRTLVPVLGKMATTLKAETALDLFTGTTRVAQEYKRQGSRVTTVDVASYSDIMSRCFISTDSTTVDKDELADILAELSALPGKRGYFTATFCEESRFFQPFNGRRVDAIRDRLEDKYKDHPLFPVLLTSLMLAADRVDSTTGVQMAYLKNWAQRSFNDLQLRTPELIAGGGASVLGDATQLVSQLPRVDLAYLDPPYNQHRYFTNYHIWETLVRWDAPEFYGVACKRIDSRDEHTKSIFNKKREMPPAMLETVRSVNADTVVVSYNDESWVSPVAIMGALREGGHEEVRMLEFDSKRYVGAQIGIFNPKGEKVGSVGRLRNVEYLFVAGDAERVARATAAVEQPAPAPALF